MSTLSNRMGVLVDEIRSSTEARGAGLEQLRSQTHVDLGRFRRQRRDTVQESLGRLRRRLGEIRESAGSLRQATRAVLDEIASDVDAAKRLWTAGGEAEAFTPPAAADPLAEAAPPPAPAAPEEKRGAEREQILRVLKAHPEGIRLVDIGNELGVDWRGLITGTKSLLDEGRIEKIDHLYYPAERTGD